MTQTGDVGSTVRITVTFGGFDLSPVPTAQTDIFNAFNQEPAYWSVLSVDKGLIGFATWHVQVQLNYAMDPTSIQGQAALDAATLRSTWVLGFTSSIDAVEVPASGPSLGDVGSNLGSGLMWIGIAIVALVLFISAKDVKGEL